MLGDLRAAIAAGDWIHAVELALAEWRHTRAPALADIIDILGARCPVIEENAERFHAWWMAEALPYRPASVSQLVGKLYVDLDGVQPSEMRTRTFRDNPLMGPLHEALADGALRDDCGILDRLAAIVAWPDDPRTARSRSGVPLLPAMFPALKKIRLSRDAIESTRGERSVYAWLRGSPLVQVTDPAGA